MSKDTSFQPRPGYKQWVAQAGKLVADLITCAGADHVITMELHDPRMSILGEITMSNTDKGEEYQGFFDIPYAAFVIILFHGADSLIVSTISTVDPP